MTNPLLKTATGVFLVEHEFLILLKSDGFILNALGNIFRGKLLWVHDGLCIGIMIPFPLGNRLEVRGSKSIGAFLLLHFRC